MNKESNGKIVNNVKKLDDTVIHIGGGGGDTVYQEIVAVSTTPPREEVNNFLYEEQQMEQLEEEESGVLAPLYVEVSHDFPLSESASGYPPSLSSYLSILVVCYLFIYQSSQALPPLSS